jgi:hypothetical protein
MLGGCGGAISGSGESVAPPAPTPGTNPKPSPPPSPKLHTLTVAVLGGGTGRVVSVPPGIDCPGTCSLTAPEGTNYHLATEAADDSVFGAWGGACETLPNCDPDMIADTSVTARFDLAPVPAECAPLMPAAPDFGLNEAVSVANSCLPGVTNAEGTLLLGLIGGDASGVVLDSNRHDIPVPLQFFPVGARIDLLPQSLNYVAIARTPAAGDASGPAETLSLNWFDTENVAPPLTLRGRLVAATAPAGNFIVAGDLIDTTAAGTVTRHEACMLDAHTSFAWCSPLAAHGPVFGVAVDVQNRTLVITGGAGSGQISAQWFEADGTPLSGEFLLFENFVPSAATWFEGRPLLGGGLAIRRMDQENDANGKPYQTASWLAALHSGMPQVQPPPAYLRPDTDLAIVRGGRAYALLPMGKPSAPCAPSVAIVAPDGTRCGSVTLPVLGRSGTCRTSDLSIGSDGTISELVTPVLPNNCAWTVWPAALR